MAENETVVVQIRITENDMNTGELLSERWSDYSRCTPAQARAFLASKCNVADWRAVDWITKDPVLLTEESSTRTYLVTADVTCTAQTEVQASSREEAERLAVAEWLEDGTASNAEDVAIFNVEAQD